MNDEINDEFDEFDTTVPPTRCTEHDVILGRGRAINNWPGNIYFRQLALKYREEYSKSNRYQKVEVALQLMDEVTARGGRFVRVDKCAWNSKGTTLSNNIIGNYKTVFDCYEVDEARAIEKTCQTLRDRHYDRHSVNSTNKQQSRHKFNENMSPSQSTVSDCNRNCHTESAISTHESARTNVELTSDGLQYHNSQNHRHDCRSSGSRNTNLFDTDEMLHRLQHFQWKYNHTAVPPDWKQDVVLADWCTVQRQLYRQVQSGYGCYEESIGMQNTLFETLQQLDFCWDYGEWHWNYWFDQLVLQTPTEPIQKSVRKWLNHQTQQYRNGTMTKHRLERLQQAGYLSS